MFNKVFVQGIHSETFFLKPDSFAPLQVTNSSMATKAMAEKGL